MIKLNFISREGEVREVKYTSRQRLQKMLGKIPADKIYPVDDGWEYDIYE